MIITTKMMKIRQLEGDGSFDSPECLRYLEECDVVVTNPPFSKFRDFIKILVGQGKDFLVVGNMNAITYKEVFPLIKENKLWLGINHIKEFYKPNGEARKFGNICWYTDIPNNAAKKPLILTKTYSPDRYPKYDNYDAIEVSRIKDIPMDYEGVMGVPITILEHYNPTQFEIVGIANNVRYIGDFPCLTIINGEKVYNRILIRPIQFEIVKFGYGDDDKYLRIKGGGTPYFRILIRRK